MASFLDNLRAVGGDISGALGNAAGSFAAGLQPPADPTAIDPNTGFSEGDMQQAKLDSLRRMSALLVAAGSTNGDARAQILAQMGNNDTSKSLYTAAQARLMNNQVQDKERERQRKAGALDKLRGADLSELTDREKQVFGLYLDAGDPDNALNFLKSVRQSQSQEIPFPDGSSAPRGVMQQNSRNFQANYAPILDGYNDSIRDMQAMGSAIDAMNTGGLADMKTWLQNYGTAFGLTGEEQQKALESSQTFKALTLPKILENMKQLGGSDSNEELRTLSAQWASTNNPETIKKMWKKAFLRTFENAATANYKAGALQRKGQMEYNGYVKFDPSNLPGGQDVYDRYFGERTDSFQPITGGSAPSAAPAAGGGNEPPKKSYKSLW